MTKIKLCHYSNWDNLNCDKLNCEKSTINKTQIVKHPKLGQNFNCDKTLNIKKTQIVKNSNCEETQIASSWIVTILKFDKTQIVTSSFRRITWQLNKLMICTKGSIAPSCDVFFRFIADGQEFIALVHCYQPTKSFAIR